MRVFTVLRVTRHSSKQIREWLGHFWRHWGDVLLTTFIKLFIGSTNIADFSSTAVIGWAEDFFASAMFVMNEQVSWHRKLFMRTPDMTWSMRLNSMQEHAQCYMHRKPQNGR